MNTITFSMALSQAQTIRCLNAKEKTKEFYAYLFRFIRAESQAFSDCPENALNASQVLELGQRLAHLCPARWNAFVSIMREIAPHLPKRLLPRRPLRVREFVPPTKAQFDALLAECDGMKRSRAGLIVRFLCFTGLRIGEAMALRWDDVLPDRIVVPAASAKNGKARSVPMVPFDRVKTGFPAGSAETDALRLRWSHFDDQAGVLTPPARHVERHFPRQDVN